MSHKEPAIIDRELVIHLIEDNPAHAKLLIRSLRDGDHAIHSRSEVRLVINHFLTGELFLEHFDKSPVRPHLILLDLRLPGIDGLAVLDRLWNLDDGTNTMPPVLVLTTSDDADDVRAAYENRANGYLVKPVSNERITKILQDLYYHYEGSLKTASSPS